MTTTGQLSVCFEDKKIGKMSSVKMSSGQESFPHFVRPCAVSANSPFYVVIVSPSQSEDKKALESVLYLLT